MANPTPVTDADFDALAPDTVIDHAPEGTDLTFIRYRCGKATCVKAGARVNIRVEYLPGDEPIV